MLKSYVGVLPQFQYCNNTVVIYKFRSLCTINEFKTTLDKTKLLIIRNTFLWSKSLIFGLFFNATKNTLIYNH